jgi:hypothetical protein
MGPLKVLAPIVEAFKKANNGQEPSDLSQITPYLATPAEHEAHRRLLQARQDRTGAN